MLFPLVCQRRKLPGTHAGVISIQLAQDFRGQFRADDRLAGFDAQRRCDLPQLDGKFGRSQIHVYTNAEDNVLYAIHLRAQFSEDADYFFAADQNVVRPFDLRFKPRNGMDRAPDPSSSGNGELRGLLRTQVWSQQD